MFRSINLPLEIDIISNDHISETFGDLLRYISPIQKILLITTKHLYDKYLNNEIEFEDTRLDTAFIENACTSTVTEIYGTYLKDSKTYGLIVGFGGGKIIDVSKYVAYMSLLPVIVIPTTLSNDGIASPISVLKEPDGRRRLSLKSQMPTKVILDINIIRKAPIETTIAGIGDLLSNISALKDWKLANRDLGEPIDMPAYILSYNASMNFYRRLLLSSGRVDILDPTILEELAHGLILSGLSMAIAGSSRPASGAEHLISHAIDLLFPSKATLHGYQVAYGMLVAEKFRGEDIDELLDVFRKVGLPRSYRELGLSMEEIVKAIQFAPRIRDRYTILSKVDLSKEKILEMVV